MKKIIILAAALLSAACFNSCKEDELPGGSTIAEPVDLTMTVENTSIVMGDDLVVTFTVEDDASETLNETIEINLSVTENNQDVSTLFKDFPKTVSFEKGESELQLTIPVGTVEGAHSVTLSAESRGYTIAGQPTLLSVADYRYVTVSVKDNTALEVKEGATFVLVASLEVPAEEETVINVAPKTGEENWYKDLPSTLTIAKDATSVESSPVTMVEDEGYNPMDLTLDLTTTSKLYPLANASLVISRLDNNEPLGTQVMDERYLYTDPDEMYVSSGNESAVKEWLSDAGLEENYVVRTVGDAHPDPQGLGLSKWTFFAAYEFHKIKNGTVSDKKSNDNTYINEWSPACFADQNTQAVETAGACDNAKYAWITDGGYLRMITLHEQCSSARDKKQYDWGTSAFYANKFNSNNQNNHGYKPQNVRIYPGMRIEVRARIRGEKTGMLPGIWFQGNQAQGGTDPWVVWPAYGEIDVMENNTMTNNRNTVEQTFHVGTIKDNVHYNPTTGGVAGFSGIDEYNIYWMEWVDEENVRMGINGQENLAISKSEVEGKGWSWPFTTTVNKEGLHILLTMMFLGKQAPTDPSAYDGITYLTARNAEHDVKTSPIPRMEVDWVRFWIDNTYNCSLSRNTTLFY